MLGQQRLQITTLPQPCVDNTRLGLRITIRVWVLVLDPQYLHEKALDNASEIRVRNGRFDTRCDLRVEIKELVANELRVAFVRIVC